MRIFITGGTGFIGKFVAQKLNDEKNELLLLVRKHPDEKSVNGIQFLKGNLGDISSWENKLKEFKPEAAIHLAWEGIPDYGSANSINNLKYGLDLFQLLADIGCKTILATGSVWEYGKLTGKLSEDLVIEPFNPFTAAKNSLNWMGREIAKEHDINFIWARLFYVYGPGQKNTSLISYLTNCVKKGVQPEIRNPNAENDFIFVGDAANAISKLTLNYNGSGIFNIGSGQLTAVKKILKMIYNLFSKKEDYQITHLMQTDRLSSSFADIAKIRRETGWLPQVNINEGLRKTVGK